MLCIVQSETLAKELVQRLPAAALAGLIGSLSVSSAGIANAADYYTPPQGNTETQTREQQPQSVQFPGSSQSAPAVKGSSDYQLPEGNQWRYSEFINAVQSGKVERVRFSKEGGQLQVCFLFRLVALVGASLYFSWVHVPHQQAFIIQMALVPDELSR